MIMNIYYIYYIYIYTTFIRQLRKWKLPDECCYKLQETLGCRTIFSMD